MGSVLDKVSGKTPSTYKATKVTIPTAEPVRYGWQSTSTQTPKYTYDSAVGDMDNFFKQYGLGNLFNSSSNSSKNSGGLMIPGYEYDGNGNLLDNAFNKNLIKLGGPGAPPKSIFGNITGEEMGQLGLGTIGLAANMYDAFLGTGSKLRKQELKSKRQAYEFDKQRIQDYTRHANAMREAGLMD
jgi:hypothetical protein